MMTTLTKRQRMWRKYHDQYDSIGPQMRRVFYYLMKLASRNLKVRLNINRLINLTGYDTTTIKESITYLIDAGWAVLHNNILTFIYDNRITNGLTHYINHLYDTGMDIHLISIITYHSEQEIYEVLRGGQNNFIYFGENGEINYRIPPKEEYNI